LPLDEVLEDHRQDIGLIKMDVEGSEPSVIRGAKETLKRFKPDMLVEFHGDKLRLVSDATPASLVAQIADLGYAFYDFQSENKQALSSEEITQIVDANGYYDFIAKPK